MNDIQSQDEDDLGWFDTMANMCTAHADSYGPDIDGELKCDKTC